MSRTHSTLTTSIASLQALWCQGCSGHVNRKENLKGLTRQGYYILHMVYKDYSIFWQWLYTVRPSFHGLVLKFRDIARLNASFLKRYKTCLHLSWDLQGVPLIVYFDYSGSWQCIPPYVTLELLDSNMLALVYRLAEVWESIRGKHELKA